MVVDADPPFPDLPGMAGRDIAPARAGRIQSPPLCELLQWWQQTAAARGSLPARGDFDITCHPHLAPHLFIIQSVATGFEMVLAGEEYAELLQVRRGRRWEFADPDPVERDFAQYLAAVARARRPFLSKGRLALTARNWVRFEGLICPVRGGTQGDADETAANALIGAAMRLA